MSKKLLGAPPWVEVFPIAVIAVSYWPTTAAYCLRLFLSSSSITLPVVDLKTTLVVSGLRTLTLLPRILLVTYLVSPVMPILFSYSPGPGLTYGATYYPPLVELEIY